jgi:glutamate racemase
VAQIGTFLARRGVKLIVIACNTAAAAGLSYAQTHGEVPVIGVIEPGARAAVRATRRRRVGVIGTEGTIASGAYGDAIAALDAGVAVSAVATPAFVDLVEEGLSHSYDGDADKVWLPDELYSLAGQYLAPLRQADIDVLVLGCTHYPVIARPIADIMGGGVRIISSAEETAREVAGTLARRGQLAPADNEVRYEFLTTGDPTKFAHLGERIFGAPLKTIEHIDFTE